MTRKTIRRIALVASGALLAACAVAEPPDSVPEPNPSASGLQSAIEGAFSDAEKQTGLARDALKLVSAGVVTWPDGSLGCPRPGGMYTQALVPGYRVQIKAGTQVLDYHAGARGQVVLCPSDRAVEPIQGEAM